MARLPFSLARRGFVAGLAAAGLALAAGAASAQSDPLPSWNDGAVKTSITGFVTRVTAPGSPDFVPPAGMSGTAALVIQNMANTLVANVFWNCSLVSSSSFSTKTCLPALLTRMSIEPNASAVRLTISRQSASSVMSPGSGNAFCPAFSISSTTWRASGSSSGR